MQWTGLNELREKYLSFFESKGHLRLDSFPLVPKNDPSLLLINSGMAPMKKWFLAQEEPPRHRVTTCQKCIRTPDIERVGITARHGTFFEMLGNFSFQDYFKDEVIPWAWEFLTSDEWMAIPKDRLHISVYEEDDEAYDIWTKKVGIAPDHMVRLGKEDNFWEHGAGPCGPCSEIYYDRGEKYGCGKPGCTVGCECDRYMEIWNNVFTQFDNDGHNNYTELEQKNIDTGMGLERLAVVCQDVASLFDVDTNRALMDEVGALAHCRYEEDDKKDVSLRIIADHVKSCTFMASDGIMPSNEGRGYVFRRLLRRAARHGRILGIEGSFMTKLAQVVIDLSKDGYPELEEKKDMILRVIDQEEERFANTIDKGLEILADLEKDMEAKAQIDFAKAREEATDCYAFKLYDTYGFPIDLTKEILDDKGLTVDEEGFHKAMQVQRETARSARKTTNYMGRDDIYQKLDASLTSAFTGYDKLEDESKVTALVRLAADEEGEDEIADAVTDGEKACVITSETPFYGTMGSQVGDRGVIESANGKFEVEDTIHLQGGKIGHIGHMVSGMFQTGETVTLKVNEENRSLIGRNHSATHLLHKALRTVLGTHVEQAGSLVTRDRLRFDFTHFSAMSQAGENIVNKEIRAALPVVTDVMSLEDAKKTGAMALFGEKYGDKVRVVRMGDFSTELCGGTHVKNTSEISCFKILSEAGVAAGVRRIEALTSDGLIHHYENVEQELHAAAAAAKSTPADLKTKIESMMEEIKTLHSENEKLKSKLAKEAMGDVMDQVQEVKGVKVLAVRADGVDMNGLRNLGDQLKEKIGEGVVVIASVLDGKVNLMAAVTDEAQKKGAHAGNLIKAIAGLVGGGGGGRPNMAQAGGKNPEGVADALIKVAEVVSEQVK